MCQESKSKPFRFSEAKTLKFIQLYRNESCLWDRSPVKRKTKGARGKALKRIEERMNSEAKNGEVPLTLKGVKIKIKNIRTVYYQQLKKIKAVPTYKPMIPWFPALNFLANYVRIDKETDDNEHFELSSEDEADMETRSPNLPSSSFMRQLDQPYEQIKCEPLIGFENHDPLRVLTPEAAASPLGPSLAPPELPHIAGVSSLAPINHHAEDEFHFFGLSVAAQLRRMPLSHAMLMQAQIQNLISTERSRINNQQQP